MSNKLPDTATEESQPTQACVVIPGSGIKRLIPTEVCEQIIDFVAVRWDSRTGYASALFWDYGVRATLEACSLTCHAWRTRSQLHLMRDLSMRASITGFRSFSDMRALLHRIPLLQGNMEDLTVVGSGLDVPRFHLVPLEIYTTLPGIASLALRGGLVYMPIVFFVSMQRFSSLTQLGLHRTTFFSVHDLRRMLASLRNLKHLVLFFPEWLYHDQNRPPCSRPGPRSRIRLASLTIEAEARWIANTHSIDSLDWFSSSGAISEIQELRLGGLMLIDDTIIAALSKVLGAAQKSPKLDTVDILFGPDVDWTPLHASLTSLPRLKHLYLACPYDTASLSQLTDCLSAILDRSKEMMHSQLYLSFDKYPHHADPPAECWGKLDSALQCSGLRTVAVDCRIRQSDLGKPVIWGDWYGKERSDEWLEEARQRFPKTCEDGHLWAYDSRPIWRHIE